MGWAVPAVNNRVLVPQGDVAVEMVPRGGIECGISNTGVGGDGKHLLDGGAAFVPELNLVGKVFALPWVGRTAFVWSAGSARLGRPAWQELCLGILEHAAHTPLQESKAKPARRSGAITKDNLGRRSAAVKPKLLLQVDKR